MKPQPGLVVVLGGSGVLGQAVVAEVGSRSPHQIAATYRTRLQEQTERTTWLHYDATDGHGDDPAAELADVVDNHAGPMAALVHCIGAGSSRHTVVQTAAGEWTELFARNVSSFTTAYRALHERIRADQASVVVVGSETTSSLPEGNGPYSAAKAALDAVAVTLAKEEASYGVRVNVVAPSRIESPDKSKSGRSGPGLTALQVAGVIASVALEESWTQTCGRLIRLGASRTCENLKGE